MSKPSQRNMPSLKHRRPGQPAFAQPGQHPNGGTGLSVCLKRRVSAKRYPVIARLTLLRQRDDMVGLLGAMQSRPDRMPPRLQSYLIRARLWDQDHARLTDEGRQVLETGLMPVEERGLYHIWYSHEDGLLGARPLLIQRDTAFFDPELRGWLSGRDAMHSSFRVDEPSDTVLFEERYATERGAADPSPVPVKIVSLVPEVICSPQDECQIALDWQLKSSDKIISSSTLIGQLNVLNFRSGSKHQPVPLELEISDYQQHLLPILESVSIALQGVWNLEKQRAQLPFAAIKAAPQAVREFRLASRSFSRFAIGQIGAFDSVTVSNLPLMPVSAEEAKDWHDRWLAEYYDAGYQSSERALEKQKSWLDHEAVRDFELPLLTGNALLNRFQREGQPYPYWHIAAMEDLSPARCEALCMPLTLISGEPVRVSALLQQLAVRQVITGFIYSDRFVKSRRQARVLRALAGATAGVPGQLLTLTEAAEMPDNWDRTLFDKCHDNHDRYWVLFTRDRRYCWKCTVSLDFLKEDDREDFVVDGYPTFTPLEESDLPPYLNDAIQKFNEKDFA